jgi:hypothetical protein
MFAIAQNTKGATTPPFTSPLIVAKGKLVNQTANIPTTPIFTPPVDGLYRFSAYSIQTVPVIGNYNTFWNFNIYWTDDAGSQFNSPMFQCICGGWGNGGYPTGTVSIFEEKAGQPISFSMLLSNGTEGGTYSLYYTLERLE